MKLYVISVIFIVLAHGVILFHSPSTVTKNISIVVKTYSPSIRFSILKSNIKTSDKGKRSKSDILAQSVKENLARTENENKEKRLESYLQGLSDKIRNSIIYPRISKRLHEKGKVKIEFTLKLDGSFENIQIKESCKHSRLNSAALDTISKAQYYGPIPKELGKSSIHIIQEIDFS